MRFGRSFEVLVQVVVRAGSLGRAIRSILIDAKNHGGKTRPVQKLQTYTSRFYPDQ